MFFGWIKSEVLAMEGSDYLVLFCVMFAFSVILAFISYHAFRRFRFIDGTATSKIRSAAQGLVELKGIGEWMQNDVILSPFSKQRCVWYHCTIEKRRRRQGKQDSWTKISDQRSEHLFRLVDDTGECIIDPDDAHFLVLENGRQRPRDIDPGLRSAERGARRP